MIYALNLDPDTGRCLSVTEDQFGADGQPRVDHFPDGDLYDYLYRDGEFIYSPPLPEYPISEKDVLIGSIFSVNNEYYRATAPIPRGEPITRFNSEPVNTVDILNALEAAQKEE